MMLRAFKIPARTLVAFIGGMGFIFGGGQLMQHVFATTGQAPPDTAYPSSSGGQASTPSRSATLHPVILREPAGPPMVTTGVKDAQGQPVKVACSTCHTTTTPNFQTHSGAQLVQFHQGLNYAHGNLTCLSCHNSADYNSLHLADNRRVEFTHVMELCGQCHGHQLQSYQHGAHGGMNGYWDRTRGPRTRNTCTNCHDPHAPKFPLVQPIFPPRDRISVPLPHPEVHEIIPPSARNEP